MGSVQSLISPQNLVAVIIVVTISVATVWRTHTNSGVQPGNLPSDKIVGKKGKKKKTSGGVQDTPVPSVKEKPQAPHSSQSAQTVPGGIPESAADASPSASSPSVSKPLKDKKRKGKKGSAASESSTPVAGPSRPSTGSGSSPPPQAAKHPSPNPPNTEAWTRVESRRKTSGQHPTTSDAGVTTATSVEEDGSSTGALEKTREEEHSPSQKTLAEKLLPKGRKTAVDDMLESSQYPELSRVIRAAPAPSTKPAIGFSWRDYEDFEDFRGADADGEDDGGWGVVKSRGKAKHIQSSFTTTSTPTQSKAPETLTKKQRQNAAKRATAKATKEEAEAARLAILAKHKRDLERERISEQFSHKGNASTARNVSGNIVNPDR